MKKIMTIVTLTLSSVLFSTKALAISDKSDTEFQIEGEQHLLYLVVDNPQVEFNVVYGESAPIDPASVKVNNSNSAMGWDLNVQLMPSQTVNDYYITPDKTGSLPLSTSVPFNVSSANVGDSNINFEHIVFPWTIALTQDSQIKVNSTINQPVEWNLTPKMK